MTQRKNFGGQVPPSIIDTEYNNCNFLQPQPLNVGGLRRGVVIFQADTTPRTFVNCNLGNCEVPSGSIVTGCNTAMVERGLDNGTEAVTIDGEVIKITHHKNVAYGRWTPSGYEDKATPVDIEVD